MKPDVRKDVLAFMDKYELTYEKVFRALGFNSRKACFSFLHSKGFNRYRDLLYRFEDLKGLVEKQHDEAK